VAAAAESWPPEGAEALEVEFLYDRLAELGFGYGPAFEGVRAAWRRGDELFAEVALPEEQADLAERFGIHPALLDAALHTAFLAGEAAGVRVPFAWSGVRLAASGASSLRVRLVAAGDDAFGLTAVDEAGAAVVSVGSLTTRAVEQDQLERARRARRESLFRLDWVELQAPSVNGRPQRVALLGERLELGAAGIDAQSYPDLDALAEAIDTDTGPPDFVITPVSPAAGAGDVVEGARDVVHRTLELLQAWSAEERFADSQLVLLTEGAVAASGDESPELATAPLWGLVRSAQSEEPGRFVLVDVDDSEASRAALGKALSSGEPQLAVRDGRMLAPSLARVEPGEPEPSPPPLNPEGTVLVTGGTGGIGALLARHLATEHGVRHLLLVSRRGPEAEGASELQAELEGLGCEARVAACDVSDRQALAELIESIPREHPLTAVIHSAAVLDDGLIASLDRERVDRVLRPKIDAAHHLHELTEDLELSWFVLFSSVVAVLGGPGQGNYTAANTFLEALAQRRRAQGLSGTALAWGLWGQASLMASDLGEAELLELSRQIRARLGLAPIAPEDGLALFDASLGLEEPVLAPAQLDRAALREQAREGSLSPVLRGLVRVPRRSAPEEGSSLAERLASLPESEWEEAILKLVQAHVAAVLGHASPEAIDPQRNFLELGFDSLGVIQLRNRLAQATGVRLTVAVVADNPTPAALAGHLRVHFGGGGAGVRAAEQDKGTLTELFRLAVKDGRAEDGLRLLREASNLRPAFASTADLDAPPDVQTLSTGDEAPTMICFHSFIAGSTTQQFARFTHGLTGARDVYAVSLPGFGRDELMPASWSAAVEALAASVRPIAERGEFVIVGYCSGGALANGVAETLEREGMAPSGFVMIDPYISQRQELFDRVFDEVAPKVIDLASEEFVSIDDDSLLSMGTYMRLFQEWRPARLETPVLWLRATDPLIQADGEVHFPPSFPAPECVVDIQADHFTVIQESAEAAAQAAETWLTEKEALAQV
jgi:NAD(P)-dependent dehydrogenase (short-subunit alcohol dehydrogenase family)/aryl carrier-like protein